jgi:hypothetical protein
MSGGFATSLLHEEAIDVIVVGIPGRNPAKVCFAEYEPPDMTALFSDGSKARPDMKL